ncbi:MAG: polyketide cyclase [Rikenellaceae bacterium]
MKRYESKQHQILLPAEQIFMIISNFNNLTPAVGDKVEEWQASEDSCSFKAKGFTVKLKMAEKVAPKHVKIVPDGEGGVPIDFEFWVQLHSVAPYDTRFRLVLQAELNMMMNMMVGGKLQGAIDQIAEQVAAAFSFAQNQARG